MTDGRAPWTDEELALRVAYEHLPKKTMSFEQALADPALHALLKLGARMWLRKRRKQGETDDLHASKSRRSRRTEKGTPVD